MYLNILLNFISFENTFFMVKKFYFQCKKDQILCIMKTWLTLISVPLSFWHRFPNSDVIPASESVHGLDDSQNEEVSKQTSPVGFHPSIHGHCRVYRHNTGEYWHSVFLCCNIQKCKLEHILFQNWNLGPVRNLCHCKVWI